MLALIVAGGTGSRFSRSVKKQFYPLGDKPLFYYPCHIFHDYPGIKGMVVALPAQQVKKYARLCHTWFPRFPVHVVAGGKTRCHSVFNALEKAQDMAGASVLISDAVRPFIRHAQVDRLRAACAGVAGAVPVLPVADTLVYGQKGGIAGYADRNGLFRVQTPQLFNKRILFQLMGDIDLTDPRYTDESSICYYNKQPVALVPGDTLNVKITFKQDLPFLIHLFDGFFSKQGYRR